MISSHIKNMIAPEYASYVPEHPVVVYSSDPWCFQIIQDLVVITHENHRFSLDTIVVLPDLASVRQENISFDNAMNNGNVSVEDWSNWFEFTFLGELFYLHLSWQPIYEEGKLAVTSPHIFFTGEQHHPLTREIIERLRDSTTKYTAYRLKQEFEEM